MLLLENSGERNVVKGKPCFPPLKWACSCELDSSILPPMRLSLGWDPPELSEEQVPGDAQGQAEGERLCPLSWPPAPPPLPRIPSLGAEASPDNRGKTPRSGWVWLMGESALCAEIPQDVWESRQDRLLQGLPGLTHPRELCNLTAMSNTIYLPRCYTKMMDFTDAAAQPIWVLGHLH